MTREMVAPGAVKMGGGLPARVARRLGVRAPVLGALAVIGLFLISAFAGLPLFSAHLGPVAPLGVQHAAPAPAAATHVPGATARASPHTTASPALPKFQPTASGRGTFFATQGLPNPSVGNQTCYSPYGTPMCTNYTNDPSINLTSDGTIGIAYTAFSNASPCTNVSPYAQTEVGFVASSNGGASWSAPMYLGNPDCSVASQYASAWTPSLTSLSNGTLVLAYIEYNFSLAAYSHYTPYLDFGGCTYCSYNVGWDRLVVTESYDNGATWTAPTVLNTSNNPGLNASAFAAERPWATAYGNTIYVAWTNFSSQLGYNYSTYPPTGLGSMQVHLIVSTDGGATWGAPLDLPAPATGSGLDAAMNPSLLVTASGELFVTYADNFSFHYQLCLSSSSCLYYVWTADVVVGSSTSNGTAFAWSTAASGVYGISRWGPFYDPSPYLAYSSATGQLFVTYSAGTPQTVCYTYGCYATLDPMVSIANSSDLGTTWSAPHAVSPWLFTPQGEQVYNPAIGVDANGTVYLEMTDVNYTTCYTGLYGPVCGPQAQVYLTSADNGTTFSHPVLISDNVTPYPYFPDGEYDTMLVAGGQVDPTWTLDVCTTYLTYGYCSFYPPYTVTPGGVTEVQFSQLYRGTGLSLTFQEKGLPSGAAWSIDVLGNLRGAAAPTSLVLSGVPSGENLTWVVPSPNDGYGTRFFSIPSLNPPYTFTANATVYENFTEQVLVNISTVPQFPTCVPGSYTCYYWYGPSWNSTYSPTLNYNITPGPGAVWANVNQTFNVSVTPNGPYCGGYCYYTTWVNLTFLSWKGTGVGSVNTTSRNISFVATGPINETASFDWNGWCAYYYNPASLDCVNSNASFLFHESGLPAGVNWSVTGFAGGQSTTNTSNGPWLGLSGNATTGLMNYAIWTVPDASTGDVWVGTATPASPVELPSDPIINVVFTLEAASQASYPTQFIATGLPTASTAWSLELGGTSFGEETAQTLFTLAGGSYSVNGSQVYLNNGTGYYVGSVSVQPLVENSTWENSTSLPASVALSGPAFVYLNYLPQYYVTVTASTGGSASPASQWVASGGHLQLSESPDAGYHFVGWTGVGPGSTSGGQSTTPNPTIAPGGPVWELATFAANAAPEYNLTVVASGLPLGVSYTLSVGERNYTGSGSFNVTGLLPGWYALSAEAAYANGSELTRYVPTITGTTLGLAANGSVDVTGSGQVNVSFATEYLLSIGATGPGTTSPLPGVYWEPAGLGVPLSVAPDPHYMLLLWNGTGPGSYTGSAGAPTVTMNGPITETAMFVWRPNAPPATYTLTVSESNLPTNVAWNVSAGSHGVQSITSSLVVGGLNGTYNVTIPAVYVAPGIRYVPSPATMSETVQSNLTLSVTFSEEVLVTVVASTGGSVSPGTGWVPTGSALTLTATAQSGWQFVNWTVDGQATATSTLSLPKVDTPTTVVATFAPVYSQTTTTSGAASGQATAIGLLAVLLVIGLAVGILVARRRPPAAGTTASPAPAPGAETATWDETNASESVQTAPREYRWESPARESASPE